MAHTYKTDPWHVKEARGAAWHPTHSPYTFHRRDLSKRIRARERRFLSALVGRVDWDALYKACRADNAPAFINIKEVA